MMDKGILGQFESKARNLFKRIKRNIETPKKNRDFLERSIKLYSHFLDTNDLCFDVGANMGNRIKPLIQLGAKIIAIEPQEKCYEFLQRKYGSKIQIVTKGLGEKTGEMDFYISNATTISSFSKDWIDSVKKD